MIKVRNIDRKSHLRKFHYYLENLGSADATFASGLFNVLIPAKAKLDQVAINLSAANGGTGIDGVTVEVINTQKSATLLSNVFSASYTANAPMVHSASNNIVGSANTVYTINLSATAAIAWHGTVTFSVEEEK